MIDRKSTTLNDLKRRLRVTRRGFTLVEIMGAVVIGTLVTVTASTMLVQIERTRNAVKKQIESQWRAERIFESLERDIASAITWLPNPAIWIPDNKSALLELVCLVTFNEPGKAFPRRLPARVVYSLEGEGSNNSRNLIRQIWKLTSNSQKPTYREVLASHLELLSARYFVDDRWAKRSELTDKDVDSVNALELTCQWSDSMKKDKRLFFLRSNDA